MIRGITVYSPYYMMYDRMMNYKDNEAGISPMQAFLPEGFPLLLDYLLNCIIHSSFIIHYIMYWIKSIVLGYMEIIQDASIALSFHIT